MSLNLKMPWLAAILSCMLAGNTLAADTSTSSTDQLFNEGMAELESGDLAAAIAAFQSILSSQPQLHRARLELALAYYRSLNYTDAKAEAEKVLADPNTPANVRSRIQDFLQTIAKDGKKHSLIGNISIGFSYDDNVNRGPSSDIIDVPGGTVTLATTLTPASDNLLTVVPSISHRYLSPKTFRIGKRDVALLWNTGGSLYHTDHASEEEFNLNVISVYTGPALIAARAWRAKANLQLDHIRLDGKKIGTYRSVNPSITWIMGNAELSWDSQAQRRDFERVQDRGRESIYLASGLSIGWVPGGGKLGLLASARFIDEDAEAKRSTNKGHQITLGAQYRLNKNLSLYGRADQKKLDYEGVEPVFGISREDDIRDFLLGATYAFKDDSHLKNWKLNFYLRNTENDANVGIYEYDRKQAGLALSRAF